MNSAEDLINNDVQEEEVVNSGEKEVTAMSGVDMNQYLHKDVVANDFYKKVQERIQLCGVTIFLGFLCAAVGRNWYAMVIGGCLMGWNILYLIKFLKFRKYLETNYKIIK